MCETIESIKRAARYIENLPEDEQGKLPEIVAQALRDIASELESLRRSLKPS